MTWLPVELAQLGVASTEEESMARERLIELGAGSFFGGYLYERAIPSARP